MRRDYTKEPVPEPAEEVREQYQPLKSVDGEIVGYTCKECHHLHTAPHREHCSFYRSAPIQKMEQKILSVARRTAGDSADDLRIKLAVAELNEANALDERDYLLGVEWKPVVEEVAAEIEEAIRLSHRLDSISGSRVQEILTAILNRFSTLRNMKTR